MIISDLHYLHSISKKMRVNFIGYGNWGSRLSKKLEDEGHVIENLVTNQKQINISYKNLYKRNEIELIDRELPTFIVTGPSYHHQIIPLFKRKVFVEKPFYLKDKKENYNNPYVNYTWCKSSKIEKIKEFISDDWENMNIELFSGKKVDRGITVVEDFIPHVVSILKSLTDEHIDKYSIHKVNDFIYKIKFCIHKKIITFNFGFSNQTCTNFKTENKLVESYTYNSIVLNGNEIYLEKEPIVESIDRYYNYYLTEKYEDPFTSNDFHNMIYELTYSNLK